jgi:hypothetical protein
VTFSIFSCFSIPNQLHSSPRQSRHPERSASQIDRKQRLYGAESKDPGDACWQMLLGAFRPQTTTEDKKIKTSERTRISYFTALTIVTYVVLPKENHMQSTEAATLDRKSGEADLSRRAVEGSAVPRTLPGSVFRQSEVESRPRRAVGSAVSLVLISARPNRTVHRRRVGNMRATIRERMGRAIH